MIINDKEYEVNSEEQFVSLIKELNGDKNPMECQHEVKCNKDEYNIVKLRYNSSNYALLSPFDSCIRAGHSPI